MTARSQNLLWATGFSLIFPIVYVPLWMFGQSEEFELHVFLWRALFIGGLFFYGFLHPSNQKLVTSLLWLLVFSAASYLAGLLFDFIRYPSDMTRYLGETVLTMLHFCTAPSLIPGIAAFFAALIVRRLIPVFLISR